eukprot:287245-Hanusia_phi.AAC.3
MGRGSGRVGSDDLTMIKQQVTVVEFRIAGGRCSIDDLWFIVHTLMDLVRRGEGRGEERKRGEERRRGERRGAD